MLRAMEWEIVAMVDFMYHGEVNVAPEDLNSFLAVAEELQIKGMTKQDSGKLTRNVRKLIGDNSGPALFNRKRRCF